MAVISRKLKGLSKYVLFDLIISSGNFLDVPGGFAFNTAAGKIELESFLKGRKEDESQ